MAAGLKTIIALSFVRIKDLLFSYGKALLTSSGSRRRLPPRHPFFRALQKLPTPLGRGHIYYRTLT